jgi:TonB family protein
MKKGILSLLASTAIILLCSFLFGEQSVQKPEQGSAVILRVFEGLKEGSSSAQSVTASYLKYMLSANIPSDAALEAEQDQIKKTFNLKDVRLVTESGVQWDKEEIPKAHHMFRLDGKLYEVAIASKAASSQPFRIEVNEISEKESRNLLDTVFTIPGKSVAVFGFEDSQGKPYFISLREEAAGVDAGVAGGVAGGVKGGVESVAVGGTTGGVVRGIQEVLIPVQPAKEEVEKKRQEFEKDAVACKENIKPPKLIKMVEPAYPEDAWKNGIQGVVILEAKTDETGRVMDALVLRSIPALDQAAIDAAKQWIYEPLIIDGQPRKVLFTVTVRFQPGEKDIEKFAQGAVKVKDQIQPPQIIKKVNPVYPEEARKTGIEGVVILEARTDISGRVKDVMVLRSVPALNQAAIDALKQWVYEPLVIDGKPREAVFTTTVAFKLNGGKREAAGATGQVEPKIITKVNPVYPEAARQAGVQGTVLLEAKIDQKGDVVAVKVLKSVPELDQAAIDALKQWKYEPVMLEGKPVGVVFTVTIRFALK